MIARLIFRYYVQSMKFVLLLAGFLSISIANDCAEGQVLVETKCYNQNDLEILVEFADSSNLFINNPDLDINDKYEYAINMGEQVWDETTRLTNWTYWVG